MLHNVFSMRQMKFDLLCIRKVLIVFLLVFAMLVSYQSITTKAQYASSSIYELRYHKTYQKLKQKNTDVFGWITIPGTLIDDPLVQSEDNDYYLHHLPDHRKSYLGSIFMDYRNQNSFINDNTILYGHNVRNSTDMFSTLLNFEDQDFYEAHPYIIISLEHEIRYYKIFASYTTHTNFYYIQTEFTKSQSLSKLIADIELRNTLNSLVTYQMDHRVLTLSTCSYRFDNARFVVHAVLIDVKEV